jgi:hypothetical protein
LARGNAEHPGRLLAVACSKQLADAGERPEWPLLCGVLALFGGFMSVMIGMLYKIVPFLVWSHLQNLGRGRCFLRT